MGVVVRGRGGPREGHGLERRSRGGRRGGVKHPRARSIKVGRLGQVEVVRRWGIGVFWLVGEGAAEWTRIEEWHRPVDCGRLTAERRKSAGSLLHPRSLVGSLGRSGHNLEAVGRRCRGYGLAGTEALGRRPRPESDQMTSCGVRLDAGRPTRRRFVAGVGLTELGRGSCWAPRGTSVRGTTPRRGLWRGSGPVPRRTTSRFGRDHWRGIGIRSRRWSSPRRAPSRPPGRCAKTRG